jgi:hypothetical protein
MTRIMHGTIAIHCLLCVKQVMDVSFPRASAALRHKLVMLHSSITFVGEVVMYPHIILLADNN